MLTNYWVISRLVANLLTKICRYHFNHRTVEGLHATLHLAWEYCGMFHWFLYGKLYSLFLSKSPHKSLSIRVCTESFVKKKGIKEANRRIKRNCVGVRKDSVWNFFLYWQEYCSQMRHTRTVIRSSVTEIKREKKRSNLKRRKICDRLTSSRIIRSNQSPGSGCG